MTKYFLNPFAVSGDKETVPDTPGASTLVNYEEGYTPEYELDPDTDPNGNYVGRQRMNQLFNDITTNLKYWQDNSYPEFVDDDGTGNPVSYPINAIVRYTDDKYYQAIVNGTTDSDPSASSEFQEWPSLSNFADNLIKGNQNWNLHGSDITLTTTPQDVLAGEEFTLGWSANGGKIADATRSASGIFTANSGTSTGTARYTYPKDKNGLITASTVKFYVDDGLGNQTLATGSNGLTVTDDASNVYLDIDFTVYTSGVGFVGISLFEGIIPAINDEESLVSSNQFLSTENYFLVQETQSTGVSGGASIAGSQTRELNTVVKNTIDGASLNSSNQVIVPKGKYKINLLAIGYKVNAHRANLYDVTTSQNYPIGTSTYSSTTSGGSVSVSTGTDIFTFTEQTTLELRHFTAIAYSPNGLGVSVSDGNPEIYAQMELWKIN